MAQIQMRLCSSCIYWQPYPTWQGVGICDHSYSRCYQRMAMGKGEPCEYFELAPVGVGHPGTEVTGSVPESGNSLQEATMCGSCHYWLPLDSIPYLGECENQSSRTFRRPTFSDKPTEECYVARSLEGLDFVWCQTHRRTIPSEEVDDHRNCRLFVSSASLPVEDLCEFTMAGD